jgi:sugar phosphate isomerase/epimerase
VSEGFVNLERNELAPTLEPLMLESGGAAIRDALDRLHALRFRFVQLGATQEGLRPRDLDGSARRDLLATLRRRELRVAGIDAWIPPRHFLDAANSDRAVHAVQRAIQLAADLGRAPISINLPAVDASSDAAAIAEIARTLSAHADKYGVAIANCAAPLPNIPASNIGVGIDPAAWLSHGKDPAAQLMANASRLISVRLCDLLHSGMRAPIGDRHQGQLDLVQYQVAASVAQYSQPIVIDARQWNDPWLGIQHSRDAWMAQLTA